MKSVVPLALLLLSFEIGVAFPQTSPKEKPIALEKTLTTDHYRAFTINNVFNYYSNNGDGSYNKYTSNGAFESFRRAL